jgi:hypothetical protein
MLRKNLLNTKSVEASDFVLANMNFSQYTNRGICFTLYELMKNV